MCQDKTLHDEALLWKSGRDRLRTPTRSGPFDCTQGKQAPGAGKKKGKGRAVQGVKIPMRKTDAGPPWSPRHHPCPGHRRKVGAKPSGRKKNPKSD